MYNSSTLSFNSNENSNKMHPSGTQTNHTHTHTSTFSMIISLVKLSFNRIDGIAQLLNIIAFNGGKIY